MGDCEITVDSNSGEDAIFEYLSQHEGEVTKRGRLDVGDVLVKANGETLIIERKSTADLAASISDSRYHEQKARQLAAVSLDETQKTRIVYLVEGALLPHEMATAGGFPIRNLVRPSPPGAPCPDSADSATRAQEHAITKTTIRDGIPVIRCLDNKTLCETVLYLFLQLKEGALDGEAAAQKRAAEGYSTLIHVKKSKNADPATTWSMMLATLPGLSMKKAKDLVDRWPSPLALAKEIEGLDRKKAIKMVAAVKTNGRNLGPAVGGRLVDVFQR